MKELKIDISKKNFIIGIASSLLVSMTFIYFGFVEYHNTKAAPIFIPKNHPVVDPYKDTKILAKAAVVYDVRDNKVLYQKNATTSLPLASITKVMTALVAHDSLPKDQLISISSDSLAVEGESGLKEDQKWRFGDLLNYTLLISSNDGAHAIAAAAAVQGVGFPEKMDAKAKELGLSSMRFNNENGLDNDAETIAGGYGSALDVAKLFSYIVVNKPELLEITKNSNWNFRALDNTLYSAKNTDLIVNKISGLVASKTGYTDLAGGNLAVAIDSGLNHPIVIVVLGSTWDGRFEDVLSLASTTMNSL